ncbi:MAG: prepilin-type N-terminal cleavage/methylation domain-containing protein [Patescibacteria group bacterium]
MNKGQSLIEILIGLAIGAILIGGAAATLTLTLRSGLQNKSIQIATGLSQEILSQIESFAEANWHNLYGLLEAPSQYHLSVSGASFISSSGVEIIPIEGVSYTRYFTVENVSRDASNSIQAVYDPANDDPSTQKVAVTTSWQQGPDLASVTFNEYIARKKNLVFHQTDWSGGGGQLGPVTIVNNKYDVSSGITINNPAGAIRKQ